MTDNRTTELRVKRLRELLDERGIEHYDHENGEPLRVLEKAEEPATSWRVDGASYCAVPDSKGTFDVWIDHCTPEQAIAATLGSGTLTAEQVREAVMSADRWEKPMGNTGLTNTHLIIRDDGWQAIADELNAELGSGTCEPVETEAITYYDEYGHDAVKVHFMECDRFGGTYEHVNGAYERCPRCGKAVG